MTQKRLFGAAAATALMTALAGCQHALPTEEMTVEEATVVEEVTEPASLMVTGSATYREKIALPEGAVLSVTLEDVAMADAVARRIETYDIPMDGISVPQAFELSVPDAETKTAKLAVRAKITSADGDLLFTTTTINPAL
ncbi:MAG TPA: YbaY family lipoprotein, partial [Aestuariivirga sp.]|nr:YbaY family lipoprotein [Aestuariivirga sp.]